MQASMLEESTVERGKHKAKVKKWGMQAQATAAQVTVTWWTTLYMLEFCNTCG